MITLRRSLFFTLISACNPCVACTVHHRKIYIIILLPISAAFPGFCLFAFRVTIQIGLRFELTVTNVINKNCQSHKMNNIMYKVLDKNDLYGEPKRRLETSRRTRKKLTAQLGADTKTFATSISDSCYICISNVRNVVSSGFSYFSSVVLLFIIYYPHCGGFLFD